MVRVTGGSTAITICPSYSVRGVYPGFVLASVGVVVVRAVGGPSRFPDGHWSCESESPSLSSSASSPESWQPSESWSVEPWESTLSRPRGGSPTGRQHRRRRRPGPLRVTAAIGVHVVGWFRVQPVSPRARVYAIGHTVVVVVGVIVLIAVVLAAVRIVVVWGLEVHPVSPEGHESSESYTPSLSSSVSRPASARVSIATEDVRPPSDTQR